MSTVDMRKIEKSIKKILKESDMENVTDKAVYSQLKERYGGATLRPQKAEIKKLIAQVYQEIQEDSDDEDETPAKKKRKTTTKKTGGNGGGLSQLKKMSPLMKEVTQYQYLSRSEVSKHVWVYIRAHDLQNPEDKRQILCDDMLKKLFDGEETVGMMQMSKFFSAHISDIPEDEMEAAKAEQAERHIKYPPKEPSEKKPKGKGKGKTKTKKEKKNEPKTMGKGLMKPLIPSDALKAVLGIDRPWTWRTEVVKKVWVYIKANNLQDPENGQNVNCDDKLKAVFDEDQINMKAMNGKYSAHLSPLPESMDFDEVVKEMQDIENKRWAAEQEEKNGGSSSSSSS